MVGTQDERQKGACERLGYDSKVNEYSMRHTGCTRAARKNAGAKVRKLAGHKDFKTTLNYVHLEDDDMADVAMTDEESICEEHLRFIMDVVEILIEKLDRMPPGDHSTGLKAVRLHIEAAVRHFARGQNLQDETAFTDAIYRCNQAFEGSSKEAYRVLASQNPERVTLAAIETYLTTGDVLRRKVLDQFANYRREWRNPSTHDYMLNFDEDEALLAIVSVTVFSIVLCDQIESKLAFLKAQASTPLHPLPTGSLLDQVAVVMRRFLDSYPPAASTPDRLPSRVAYERLEGALAGYLSAELSAHNIRVSQSVRMEDFEVDIVVETHGEAIAIELKSVRRLLQPIVDQAVHRVTNIIASGKFSGGIVFAFSGDASAYEIQPVPSHSRIKLVLPAGASVTLRN